MTTYVQSPLHKFDTPAGLPNEPPDVPADLLLLRDQIEARIGTGGSERVADAAARDAIPTSRCFDGKTVYVVALDTWYRWIGGGWKPWSSSWRTYTAGSMSSNSIPNMGGTTSTSAWRYRYVDGMVQVRGRITLAGSDSVYGSVTLPLPVSADTTTFTVAGRASFQDVGVVGYAGIVDLASTGTVVFRALKSDDTFTKQTALSATSPFAWSSGDFLEADFLYPPA